MRTKPAREEKEDEELKRLADLEKSLKEAIAAQATKLATMPTKEGSESLAVLQAELIRVRTQIAERTDALGAQNQGQEITKTTLLEPIVCDGYPDPEKDVRTRLEELKQKKLQPVLVVARRNDGRNEGAAKTCKWWGEVSR